MKLELSTLEGANVRTIVVKGDVDMDSSPELRDELKRALKGVANAPPRPERGRVHRLVRDRGADHRATGWRRRRRSSSASSIPAPR